MFRTSFIEISKQHYRNNLDFIKSVVGNNVRISSVIKGNAYGHGLEEFMPMAQDCGINHFSVFSADEALRIHPLLNPGVVVTIMGDVYGEALEWAISSGIEFYVFDRFRLEKAVEIAKKVGVKAKIHIELETGMNRTGFEPSDITRLSKFLNENKDYLSIQGCCTHFAGAENIANYPRIKNQIKVFKMGVAELAKNDINPTYIHACCSAAVMRFPEMHYNMVRVGIMQYGFWPNQEVFAEWSIQNDDKADPLRRLITWRSHVMSVKDVAPGKYIGYGSSYIAHRNMKIAIVPVGYSQGFSRSLSNHGRVLIGNNRQGVVGIVNMNSIAVDVSELSKVKPGDEVVLIGRQGDKELAVSSFGEFAEMMNYELLTRLPYVIPRLIIEDKK